MGAYYFAKAIIGVKLPNEDDIPKAKVMVRKRAFDHGYDDDGEMEYDPRSGKKLWLDEKEEVESGYPSVVFDVHGEWEDIDLEQGQTIIKFPNGIKYAYGTDCLSWYVGFVVETGSTNGGEDIAFSKLPNIEHLKGVLRNTLEPIGFWNEDDFGLYCILYCSY